MRNSFAFSIPVLLSLVGCGGPEVQTQVNSSDAEEGLEQFQLARTVSEAFCPKGSTFLESHRLCVTASDAIGPFTPTMVNSCIAQGGGEGACRSSQWGRSFAMGIRGTGSCMPGSSPDSTTGECVAGVDAYGPFSKEIVAGCKAKGGGPSCETMRIHKSFVTLPPDSSSDSRNYIRVTRQNWKLYGGLYALKVELLSSGGSSLASLWGVSGQDYAQWFRKASSSVSGSNEPLPEGIWRVRYPDHGLAGNEWGGTPGNYNDWVSSAIGPTFQEIVTTENYKTARSAIGVHLDANRSSSPGTAGCLGLPSMDDLKKYHSWFKDSSKAPRTFVVDWGLGTIPSSVALARSLQSVTSFGLSDAYIPLAERVKLMETGN